MVGVEELASDATLAEEVIELRLKAAVMNQATQILRATITPDDLVRLSRETSRHSYTVGRQINAQRTVARTKKLLRSERRSCGACWQSSGLGG
jgi:hypothetical protein